MEKEIIYHSRCLNGKESYEFQELIEAMTDFKNKYPEGKNFKIESLAFEMYGDMDSYFRFTCDSPETKEEEKQRIKAEKRRRAYRYIDYLELKAEFEGETKEEEKQRIKAEKRRRAYRYIDYLKLKAEFEGESK